MVFGLETIIAMNDKAVTEAQGKAKPEPAEAVKHTVLSRGTSVADQKEMIKQRHSNTFEAFRSALAADDDWAWTWFCNIAMVAFDAGAPVGEANEHAATFMFNVFGVDVRSFDQWKDVPDEDG